jgi:BlaI family transcriptional regulator, penicillinase repressor
MTTVARGKLTRFELEIMDVLWELEEASVRHVLEALPEQRRPAYTTVQTIMQRLEVKGAVERSRKIGNAFMFKPLVSRRSALGRLLDDVLALAGGPQPLIAHLVEEGKLSLEDLREVERAGRAVALPAPGGRKGGER